MYDCEILAPAGGEQAAYVALDSGANAVYLGLSRFSARAGAENFDLPALFRVVKYAHILNAKVYVALNTLVKENETEDFFRAALDVYRSGADGILVQDIFLGKLLKQTYPEMTLHLSTQAGCCNEYGARLAKEYGFSRVVLARETPLEEIAKIAKIIETEVFVQGALCSCFSGQCYLSSFAGNHSGNRGQCKQPCRKKYSLSRKGYEEEAYALSLSDLSVGRDVEKLLEAGVYSLKIEGRMRRTEYVAAAVEYYRAIVDGVRERGELSRLKRAYNRGDYTHGLAFGQKKDFLSRKVQGHVGEKVGEITIKKGKPYCKTEQRFQSGDGFKILREGKEVGGGSFLHADEEGFFLASSARLAAGDEVRVTTDGRASEISLSVSVRRNVPLSLCFYRGQPPRVLFGDKEFVGEEILEKAEKAPLTADELKKCFEKTDGLPLSPVFERVETDGVFLAKSRLNALRRNFYEWLTALLNPPPLPIKERKIATMDGVTDTAQSSTQGLKGENRTMDGVKRAAITSHPEKVSAEITVIKPCDYRKLPPMDGIKGEKYLYLPAYFTAAEEEKIKDCFPLFDGFYAEGSYGILLAEKYGKKLFAGTGFNLTNRYAVAEAKRAGARYYALSKELTSAEAEALLTEDGFVLTVGGIKVMDLLYCPFEKTCSVCDKREIYTLTDEGGREFPLRRYRLAEDRCFFEVYNCAHLLCPTKGNRLIDCTVTPDRALVEGSDDEEACKKILGKVTTGHGNRSLL